MPIDIFASARSTALIGLVAASFSTPVVVKSDAFDQAASKLRGGKAASAQQAEPAEVLLAGGIAYELPADWDRLGASAATGDDSEASSREVASIVSAVCPGGSAGGDCKGGTRLTFLTYSGRDGHELPNLAEFEAQLDARFDASYKGFTKGEARMRPGADGTRYLDYAFSWTEHGTTRHQRVAAYRSDGGAGVVIVGTGRELDAHAKDIDAFLASAHEPLPDEG
ncbi:MAG: hypothetical protein KDC46_08245 [Thermoleophilia bacterium]|nr:hypothetical protein [Thermoleophilia bacterium]